MNKTLALQIALRRARMIARREPRRAAAVLIAAGCPGRDAVKFVLTAARRIA